MKRFKQFLLESSTEDFHGEHEAPGPENGDPMHNVTKSIYPKDFHGPNGLNYYANEGNDYDHIGYNIVSSYNNRPNATLTVHRAVPKHIYDAAPYPKNQSLIKRGDWVTQTKEYAHDHGRNNLNDNYKIVSKTVNARDLYTDGNSIHEWGYHPTPRTTRIVDNTDERRKKLADLHAKIKSIYAQFDKL